MATTSAAKPWSCTSRCWATSTVETGKAAVEAVRTALDQKLPYGLIFLDIIMPECDGQEALQQIRSLEAKRGIHGLACVKVVMVTCLDDHKQVMISFTRQAEAYLVKPVDSARLRLVLRDFGILGNEVSPVPDGRAALARAWPCA